MALLIAQGREGSYTYILCSVNCEIKSENCLCSLVDQKQLLQARRRLMKTMYGCCVQIVSGSQQTRPKTSRQPLSMPRQKDQRYIKEANDMSQKGMRSIHQQSSSCLAGRLIVASGIQAQFVRRGKEVMAHWRYGTQKT